MNDIVFYSLMLFDENRRVTGYNGLKSSFEENVNIYINQCLLLRESLNYFGYKLKIVTNDVSNVIKLSNGTLDLSDLIYMPLSNEIPDNTSFYLSMHKFILIKYLVSIKISHYAFIVDSDLVCLKKIPSNIKNVLNKGFITYYDISDQIIPAYGINSVMNDVQLIHEENDLGVWCGGEIFGADYFGLREIDDCINIALKKYFECYSELNQKSDENLFSLFIQQSLLKGFPVFDISKHFFLSRFWSLKTLHIPDAWNKVKTVSLLHLPADKSFLNDYFKLFQSKFSPEHFIDQYEKYLSSVCNYELIHGLNYFKTKKLSRSQIFRKKLKKLLF